VVEGQQAATDKQAAEFASLSVPAEIADIEASADTGGSSSDGFAAESGETEDIRMEDVLGRPARKQPAPAEPAAEEPAVQHADKGF
jgi:hypothetical protein